MHIPAAIIARLGKMSDTDLAAIAGVTSQAVGKWRRTRGIPRYQKPKPEKKNHGGQAGVPHVDNRWRTLPATIVAQLGKRPDRELAMACGVTAAVIRERRKHDGIAGFPHTNGAARTWTAEEIAMLGTMRDAAVAKALRLHHETVKRKRVSLGIQGFRPVR